MSTHLSPLELDEAASGLLVDQAHLETCDECRSLVAQRLAQNAKFLQQPRAKAQFEALASPRKRIPLRFALVAFPLAAALALFVFLPRTADERLKGAPTVTLLDQAGNVVTHAPPGQQLTLAVGSTDFPHVKVSARADDGSSSTLFEGDVARGARVPVMKLEVTPGNVQLTADFSDGERRATATTTLLVP